MCEHSKLSEANVRSTAFMNETIDLVLTKCPNT